MLEKNIKTFFSRCEVRTSSSSVTSIFWVNS